MVKNDLRERGYYIAEKIPRPSIITVIWIILTLLMIVSTFAGVFAIIQDVQSKDKDASPIAYIFDDMMVCLIILIVALLIYLYLKLALTLIFCSDRANSVKMKFLELKAMPVCFCREAFKVWQIVVIYLAPVVLIYSLIFVMCLVAQASAGAIIIVFFMAFFLCFDLTLVIYVLFIKIKEKVQYISVDQHVYGFTLFNQSYVRENKKAKRRL